MSSLTLYQVWLILNNVHHLSKAALCMFGFFGWKCKMEIFSDKEKKSESGKPGNPSSISPLFSLIITLMFVKSVNPSFKVLIWSWPSWMTLSEGKKNASKFPNTTSSRLINISILWWRWMENFMNWNYARMKCTFDLWRRKCSHIFMAH